MRRPLFAILPVASLALALAGCTEVNVGRPDGWWLPDASGVPDAGPAEADAALPLDAAVWVAVTPPADAPSDRLNAVAANGAAMLAVGNAGTVLSYDPGAQEWTTRDAATTEDLTALCSVTETGWWIVGGAGTVLRYDGAAGFAAQALPGGAAPHLKAVAASAEEVWVGGAAGGALQVRRGAPTPGPTGRRRAGGRHHRPVGTAAPVLAGGRVGQRLLARLLHELAQRDGASGEPALRAIWGSSEDDLWLVGDQVWRFTTQDRFRNLSPSEGGGVERGLGSGPTSVCDRLDRSAGSCQVERRGLGAGSPASAWPARPVRHRRLGAGRHLVRGRRRPAAPGGLTQGRGRSRDAR
jgi:hypothetical protein